MEAGKFTARPDCSTIDELVRLRARQREGDLAIEVAGTRLRYGDLDVLSDRVAASLAAMGVEKGDRVATILHNCPEQIFVWFGAVKLGAIWVPFNVSLKGEDLAYTVRDAGPKVLVCDTDTAECVATLPSEVRQDLRVFVVGEEGPRSAELLFGEAGPPPPVENAAEDPAVIIYTGGTTGMPKGVVLPHYAWVAAGQRYVDAFEVGPGDRHYSVLALFHVGGAMIGFMGPLVAGIPTHFDRWFSVSRFWERAREVGATVIDPIGTMVTLLCQRPADDRDRDHKVRVSLGVLSQVPEDVAHTFVDRYGVAVVNVYSLTETGGVLIVHNKIGSPKPFSNGKPWGWCDLAILDDQDRPCDAGEIGQICLRPTVPFTFMLGYFNSPERTVQCVRNLWLHTGDLGYLDEEGFLFFAGRQAHWLRTRGENVSAYEVENILSGFDGVAEVVVVGVPAPLGEEDGKAYIIPAEGRSLDPATLIEWCSTRMAPFKVPRYVEFVREFPRSATKREVERHKLRSMPNDGAWDAETVFGRRSSRARRGGTED